MAYMVHLAIENASTFSIVVVRAPFALTRGGASPVALVRFISYRREEDFSSDIRDARGGGSGNK